MDLRGLREAFGDVRHEPDADAVHALRTAMARVDAWLALEGLRGLRRRTRAVRRASGAVRDLDVLLATALPPEVRRDLRGQRVEAARALREVLADDETSTVLRELDAVVPASRHGVDIRLRRLAHRALAARGSEHRGRRARHRLRRRLRVLRDALAVLGLDAGPLRALVTALGRVRDHEAAAQCSGEPAVLAPFVHWHARERRRWRRRAARLEPAAMHLAADVQRRGRDAVAAAE